ncbi:MAG: hypothetical protein R2751_17330 [Bacteroidales bacterium]
MGRIDLDVHGPGNDGRIHGIVVGGRLLVVQVIACRKDGQVPVPGRFPEGGLVAPGLHDHPFDGKAGMDDLVPAHHLLPVGSEEVVEAVVEICLEVFVALHVFVLHERLNGGVGVPVGGTDLVASDVEVGIRKQHGHFPEKGLQEFINLVPGGIHHRGEHAEGGVGDVGTRGTGQFGIPHEPGGGMPRQIELGHHPDAPVGGKFHHLADVAPGIIETVRTHLMQTGKAFRFDPEALVIGEVPVEDVHFYGGHGFQIAQDHVLGDPMTAGIDHESPPGIAGLVEVLAAGQDPLSVLRVDQLGQGFQAVEDAGFVGGGELDLLRADLQGVGFILPGHREGRGGIGAMKPEFHLPGVSGPDARTDFQVSVEALHGAFDPCTLHPALAMGPFALENKIFAIEFHHRRQGHHPEPGPVRFRYGRRFGLEEAEPGHRGHQEEKKDDNAGNAQDFFHGKNRI